MSHPGTVEVRRFASITAAKEWLARQGFKPPGPDEGTTWRQPDPDGLSARREVFPGLVVVTVFDASVEEAEDADRADKAASRRLDF